MDLNIKIYKVFSHLVNIGYYNIHTEVKDTGYEEFENHINRLSPIGMLLAIKEDVDNNLSFNRRLNQTATDYFKSEFSIEEYPEVYV